MHVYILQPWMEFQLHIIIVTRVAKDVKKMLLNQRSINYDPNLGWQLQCFHILYFPQKINLQKEEVSSRLE